MRGPRPVPVGFIETDKYYVCGVGRHCLDGNQKLHVRVSNNCGQGHISSGRKCQRDENMLIIFQ